MGTLVDFAVDQQFDYGEPFPAVAPTMSMDFMNAVAVDSRVTFARSTTATYMASDGLIKTAAINEPRFNHNPTTLEPLGLLFEDSGGNLFFRSETLEQVAWGKTGTTITTDATIAPDGQQTADRVVEDTSTGNHHVQQQTTGLTSGGVYTISVFAKADTKSSFVIGSWDGVAGRDALFNLSTGTILASSFTRTTITPYPNGWFRCTATRTMGSTTNFSYFYMNNSSSTFATNYTGDGTSGMFFWGAQLENTPSATSYIPTVGSQVNRGFDVARILGTSFTEWYRDGYDGTMYVEFDRFLVGQTSAPYPLSFTTASAGSFSDAPRIVVRTDSSMAVQTQGFTGTLLPWSFDTTNIPGFNVNTKAAVSWSASNVILGVNGTTTSATPSSAVPSGIGMAWMGAGGSLNGHIKKIAYYPVALTNNEVLAMVRP